jgi:hypothetical protein
MNSANIIRFGFVAILLSIGLPLAGKALHTTPVRSVEIEAAPVNVGVCQMGHAC